MTYEDNSSKHFGLIDAFEHEKFAIDESKLHLPESIPINYDLFSHVAEKMLHGNSLITHIDNVPDVGKLVLSCSVTQTSRITSFRYIPERNSNRCVREATSVIRPHDETMPLLAEHHFYNFRGYSLVEGRPKPLETGQYRLLSHVGFIACAKSALRIAA